MHCGDSQLCNILSGNFVIPQKDDRSVYQLSRWAKRGFFGWDGISKASDQEFVLLMVESFRGLRKFSGHP
jgi:hypothetical protein